LNRHSRHDVIDHPKLQLDDAPSSETVVEGAVSIQAYDAARIPDFSAYDDLPIGLQGDNRGHVRTSAEAVGENSFVGESFIQLARLSYGHGCRSQNNTRQNRACEPICEAV
jgi:hypothetical protein